MSSTKLIRWSCQRTDDGRFIEAEISIDGERARVGTFIPEMLWRMAVTQEQLLVDCIAEMQRAIEEYEHRSDTGVKENE